MPAGITEAYLSPFDKTKPSSHMHDANSFTRSSSTQSLRNEYYNPNTPQTMGEFNTNYQIHDTQNRKLPDYTPYVKYPTLHPAANYHLSNMVDYRPPDDKETNNGGDPHRGAGWIQPHEESYMVADKSDTIQDTHTQSECDDLINKVLTNKYCRRILKKLLLDDDDESDLVSKTHTKNKLPPFKKIVEGFSTNTFSFEPEIVKNIIIYGLMGLLLLCILDLVFKIGQLIKK